jgi:hypothetical protein
MSDDDLWRKPDQAASSDASTSDAGASDGGQANGGQGVSHETQPLHGPSSPPPPPQPTASAPHTEQPSAVPPPANPFGHPSPYGAPPPQNPYGNQGPTYAPPPNPYPRPHEYAAPQSPYGSPYQASYVGGALPDHPSATTAMVLGIVGLLGIACGFLLVVSPFAWYVGAKAVREIDAAPGRYAGRDKANAGKIMGIIGTVLLVLAILALIAVIALVAVSSPQPTLVHEGTVTGTAG